ncbi:MAG: hypothetical protein Q9219_000032 [cf. Caloplaca sp. 3 TL-2023]
MLDISQPSAGTKSEGLEDPLESLKSVGSGWPMDVDSNILPGVIPDFEHYPTRQNWFPLTEDRQNGLEATGYEDISPLARQPNMFQTDQLLGHHLTTPTAESSMARKDCFLLETDAARHNHMTRMNENAFNSGIRCHHGNQMTDNHLTLMDQGHRYVPIAGVPIQTSSAVGSIPRQFPGTTGDAAGPWSPWIASELTGGVHPVSELVFEPAMDAGTIFQDVPGFGQPGDRFEQAGAAMLTENDACAEDNIGPPPPLEPLGLPSKAMDDNNVSPSQDLISRVAGGRHGPLNDHSRRNARAAREKGQATEGSSAHVQLAILAEQHEPEKLRAFASKRVHRWLDNHMTVYLTWGYFWPIKCDVTEIQANDSSLLLQNQYRLVDLKTDQYNHVQVPSPPLGMMLMYVSVWRQNLNKYLEDLLRTSFPGFPKVCYRGDACRVEREFLLPIFDYHGATTETEAHKLVHQGLKLVVLTFIMTHSMTLVENTKDDVYNRLRNPPPERYGHHTSPRWLNKQFKFLLCTLHRDILRDFLTQIQKTLRRSKKGPVWAALFASMVILSMTTGSFQVAVRGKEETDKAEGTIGEDDTTAEIAIEMMDERLGLLRSVFHQKYGTLLNRELNPVRKPQDCATLDGPSQSLAARATEIIEKHHEFLVARHVLPPPAKASEPQTGRLLAQFLLEIHPPAKQHHHQPTVPASIE